MGWGVEEWGAIADKLVAVIVALTGLLGVLYGKRKWPQIRESLRPRRGRAQGSEPDPYQHYLEQGPMRRDSRRPPLPPDFEERPTLRPKRVKSDPPAGDP